MNIRPSAAIRQNYNEIAEMCRNTAEPVFLTKNGEGDLVVMDIGTYNRREKMLKLREELLAVEEDLALVLLVGAEETFHHGGLTGAVFAHKTHDSTALYIQVDVVKHSVAAE